MLVSSVQVAIILCMPAPRLQVGISSIGGPRQDGNSTGAMESILPLAAAVNNGLRYPLSTKRVLLDIPPHWNRIGVPALLVKGAAATASHLQSWPTRNPAARRSTWSRSPALIITSRWTTPAGSSMP
jgi:hypothetical protein